ncbi:PREDICTED: uncharacterized protein LOC106100150 isoform X3 [Papilio polytes]|uniref:uncharacterized protein LOC106100150 isoform X3 n=1 Tax=Papilio polytes TaxID=76194 RepID=UPI000675BF4E|nr:PREDICTED: uncharacterized protein LOC106100150 isoform X3 [Papilio polytes]
METRHYWEENGHVNYNSNDGFGRAGAGGAGGAGAGEQLAFAAPSEDEADFATYKKGKVLRQDPMSHRIIEKRRRDRMNNCLADLSRLIPPEYLKKGRGRVEKTEIIEMAIRHLKFLQDRVNASEVQPGAGEGHYRAGYQEAVGEALRYLSEAHGYPADGLCAQLATHLQRHCDHVTKESSFEPLALSRVALKGSIIMRDGSRDKGRSLGSSSETASSSSSSLGYSKAQAAPRAPPYAPDVYDATTDGPYNMDCDRVVGPVENGSAMSAVNGHAGGAPGAGGASGAGGAGGKREALRKPRKPEHDDFIHSYKFKNSIERRFSRSQDTEAVESQTRVVNGKAYSHKRRRAARPAPAASTSASASTEEARDTSPQDTSSESPHRHVYEQFGQYEYEKPPPAHYVPVFALNTLGKYYVPLSVEYACVSRQLRACDAAGARAPLAALHPVTIHVNFSPCLNYHVKRDPDPDPDWRPV